MVVLGIEKEFACSFCDGDENRRSHICCFLVCLLW